jgi:tripartite-type tricarboxylate transporter receptor subunit TctC
MGGDVTAGVADYPSAAGQIQAGKLRALAIGSRRSRIDCLPDVPTIAESGYPGYEADLWYGVFAPSKTPKEKVTQRAVCCRNRDPEIKEKLFSLGFYPTTLGNAPIRGVYSQAIMMDTDTSFVRQI